MKKNEIFISHSTKDCEVAKIVKDFLVKIGVARE